MSGDPPPRTFEPYGEIFASPAGSIADSEHGGDQIATESVNTSLNKLPIDYWNKLMTQDERDLAEATALTDLRRVYGGFPFLAGKPEITSSIINSCHTAEPTQGYYS